jgi:tetratricopeptide (TPR) repeat protein
MNRLLLIAMIAMLLIAACSVNTGLPQPTEAIEEFTGVPTDVAILPLKTMDARSRNIRKILEVRDLGYAFSKYPQFTLMNMEHVASEFNMLGIRDVDDMDLDELKEVADELNADVVISGNISSLRADLFAIAMTFYSTLTGELRQVNFNVPNLKEARWEALDKSMMTELDRFISTEVDKIYNFATNFYAAGNYAEAERQLTTAVGLDPDRAEAYYYLGATYYRTDRYALAEENFNKALDLEPQHNQTLVLMNEMFEKSGENLKRIGVMERIASQNEDAELWLAIGNLYAEAEQMNKARESFENALEIDEDNPLVKTRLAFLLYDQQQFADAIPYLESAYDSFPENDLISRRLALSYQRAGRMDQAISRYEGLIENNPSNIQAYLNVVSLYRSQATEATDPAVKTQNFNKAVDAMNRLIQIDPENPMAYLNLASIYLAQNNNTLAERNANETIQRDPSLYQPYVILGTISQSRGTNDYNRFADLERRASEAVGREATNLSRERDAARNSANAHFRSAVQQLTTARSLTTEPETLADINNRISVLNNLVTQTTGY